MEIPIQVQIQQQTQRLMRRMTAADIVLSLASLPRPYWFHDQIIKDMAEKGTVPDGLDLQELLADLQSIN